MDVKYVVLGTNHAIQDTKCVILGVTHDTVSMMCYFRRQMCRSGHQMCHLGVKGDFVETYVIWAQIVPFRAPNVFFWA